MIELDAFGYNLLTVVRISIFWFENNFVVPFGLVEFIGWVWYLEMQITLRQDCKNKVAYLRVRAWKILQNQSHVNINLVFQIRGVNDSFYKSFIVSKWHHQQYDFEFLPSCCKEELLQV